MMGKYRRWTVILSVGTITLIAFGFFLLGGENAGSVAAVSVNGEEIARVDLGRVKEPYSIQAGAHNSVRVEPGGIFMEYADCPDQLCVKMGRISKLGAPIVCLPNKVVIQMIKD